MGLEAWQIGTLMLLVVVVIIYFIKVCQRMTTVVRIPDPEDRDEIVRRNSNTSFTNFYRDGLYDNRRVSLSIIEYTEFAGRPPPPAYEPPPSYEETIAENSRY